MPPSSSSEYRSYETESDTSESESKWNPRWLIPVVITILVFAYFTIGSPFANPLRFISYTVLITIAFLLIAFTEICLSAGLDLLLGSKKDSTDG
jgi:uncharacterized membrane protein